MYDSSSSLLTGNRLLSALPEAEAAFLRPHLELVPMQVGTILANPGDTVSLCHFPTKGMISLLSVTERGDSIEVAYVGHEGMAGIGAVFGGQEVLYQMLVQAETECLIADAKVVAELFEKGEVFHDLMMRYIYALLKQMSQTCLCNHFHTIETRLCRWLTVMSERSGNKKLSLTQEFLAHMLGVQRTSIGLIAHNMQAEGVIRYSRGRLKVKDIDHLRASACECYRIVNAEYEGLFREPARHGQSR
jgi:CRP-like cAMP-binding protein